MQKELEKLKIKIKDYEKHVQKQQMESVEFYKAVSDMINSDILAAKEKYPELKLLDWDLETAICKEYIQIIIEWMSNLSDIRKAGKMINVKRINKHLQNISFEYDKLISEVKEIIYKEKI